MIVFLFGAPGIGKTTLIQNLGERLGCPYLEMSLMPEFRIMNGQPISYEKDEDIAVDNLLLLARNYIKHGHKIVLLSDFRIEVLPRIITATSCSERLMIKLIINDDAELRRRVLNPTRTSNYRNFDEAVEINLQLQTPIVDDELMIDITGMSLSDELELLTTNIYNRLGSI